MPYNITEAATWTTNVRGVATTDPALGGATGEANMSAEDLTDRTLYLKTKLEALGATGTWTEAQFTADGTWNVPAGVSQILVVRAKGGGGGGAGSWTSASAVHHSGGGGGEGAEVTLIPITVTAGWTLDIDIGAGGAGGTAIVTNDTYSSGVLGSAGADTTLKHGATTLLTVGGGLGGGVSSPNPSGAGGSGVFVGQMLAGVGGSATADGVTTYGQSGGDGSSGGNGDPGGKGGGQRGGLGGVALSTGSRAATVGVDGGGGGGGEHGNGAAGGNGSLRIGYWAFDITGNT